MSDNDLRPPQELTDERTTLIAFLDYLRESIIRKATGLSDAEVRKPMVASGTSLMWLVKHLTDVESYWFDVVFVGGDLGEAFSPTREATQPDDEIEELIAQYRAAIARANAVAVAAGSLEAPATKLHRRSQQVKLRWILVHMIEETARHAGHADIIRELLDGNAGR